MKASIAGLGTMSCASLLLCLAMTGSASATLFTGDIFFTTFNPTIPVPSQANANVGKVGFTYDNAVPSFTLGAITPLARTIGADGLVFDPNTGHLLVGGQGSNTAAPIHEVNQNVAISNTTPSSNVVISVAAGSPGGAYHLSVDPNGNTVYVAGIPGGIGVVGLPLSGAGSTLTISGFDTGVDSLAFAAGNVFYTSSGPGGLGSFGTINLTTGVTSNLLSNIEAHGMTLDPFTGDLILFGGGTINQIDPTNPTVFKSQRFVSGVTFDQGTVDGLGHLFVADNGGSLFFMDYAGTGLVGGSNFTAAPFLIGSLDDLAPTVGPGSNPAPEPATLALLGLGIAGLAWCRRKRSN